MIEAVQSPNSRLRCRDLMTKSVRTTSPEATLRDVAIILREGDFGSLPVVEDERLIGIVTDRDIVVRSVAEGQLPDSPIREAMTSELFTVGTEDFVFDAARLMGEKQIRRIPVVNPDGSLAGIISMADVALSTEDEQQIAETLEEISSGSSFWNKS